MTEHFIRPDVQAYLDTLTANPRPDERRDHRDDAADAARDDRRNARSLDLPVGELGEIRDLTMPGPGGEIALRLFDPRKQRGPGPVVVFYHGGGFVVGSIDTHAALAAEMRAARSAGGLGRIPPRAGKPWPAGARRCRSRSALDRGERRGVRREFTSLVLCGDSAGATLTIVTALALRDNRRRCRCSCSGRSIPRRIRRQALSLG